MKVYHTADVHIGLKFGTYDSHVSKRLVEERFGVLERMVRKANEEQCAFFVIAGDLFENVSVPDKDVKRTVEILTMFTGEAVLVLAGNHDYCRDRNAKPWSTVVKHAENTNIYPLLSQDSRSFDLGGRNVVFYACPCPDRTSAEHQIGWVQDVEKDPSSLHIGIAHGNVEGLSLDDNHAYYTMTERELRDSGCTTWLLGHVHVPAPKKGLVGTPTYFMPGAPAPDSVRMSHPGHAWIITFDVEGNATYESDSQAEIRFARFSNALHSSHDITALTQKVESLPLSSLVIDLQLSGALDQADIDALSEWIGALQKRALHVSYDSNIKQRLTAESIAAEYPSGTLANLVLSELLADTDHPDDAHLAYDILRGGVR
jgi:DNA repair exonuclease SbcCD nuclease subunit